MRILQVDKFLRRQGGAASYMLALAGLQRDAGHEVEFFSMADPDNEPARYESSFAPHVELDRPPGGALERAAGAARFVWNPAAARGIDAVIADFRPDVAHLHNVYHQLTPSIIWRLRRRGVPVVLTAHDYKLVCPTYLMLDKGQPCTACLDGRLRHAVERRCRDGSLAMSGLMALETRVHRILRSYGKVGAVIAPSRFMVATLAAANVATGRVHHVPHFVVPPSLLPPPPPGAVVFVGRLSHEKGVHHLIDAIARTDVELHVVGDGPARAALEAQAVAVAPGQVRFAGQLGYDGVVAELAGASALVLPSEAYENQPISVLEAMAAGRAAIVSDRGGSPELVEDGVTGLVVPAGDIARLAGAIAALAGDPGTAAAMGAAARERAVVDFDPALHLERLEAVYRAA